MFDLRPQLLIIPSAAAALPSDKCDMGWGLGLWHSTELGFELTSTPRKQVTLDKCLAHPGPQCLHL